MPKLPWLRLYTEILDDPKMARLTGEQFRDWVYVLAMAREAEEPGLIAMSLEDAAWRARRSPDEFRRSLDLFEQLGMVALLEGFIRVVHFADRQKDKPSDQPERVRERVRRHRKRPGNAGETPSGNADETPTERAGNGTDKIRLDKSRGDSEEKDLPPPPPDMSQQEREILRALHDIKGHVPDFEADLAHVRRWLVRFPAVNVLDEIDRCETWWTGPKAPRGAGKANWRSRVRNWLQKQEEIRAERGQKAPATVQPPAPPRPRPFTPSQGTIDSIARTAHLDYKQFERPYHAPATPPAAAPEDGEPTA